MYAREYGKLRMLIGFSTGEERRVKPVPDAVSRSCLQREYPLIDLGLNRRGCQEVTAALVHEVPMPSNCRKCPYATPAELVRHERQDPQSMAEWMAFEEAKLAHPKWAQTRNHTVFARSLTIRQTLETAREKYQEYTTEELDALRFTRGHCITHGF